MIQKFREVPGLGIGSAPVIGVSHRRYLSWVWFCLIFGQRVTATVQPNKLLSVEIVRSLLTNTGNSPAKRSDIHALATGEVVD
ncbi:hypothetical protein [Aminobacter ciceronei]|uniref:Uncharacterized protein n=1 Tax=Aminobacter ciceronei TaxID=150723 RepID=A0ABR6C8Z4_9HYPH|nr:hypothetical protein [Aminobacter ciceronei]MBA8907176.1 hypothetical protein [Aminobacter ciceronei]MBA9021045.1 hypothetical protein [Aminobacter ciceronei]